MAFSLLPDRVYPSIHQIDWVRWADKGITLVLIDLDNTLAPYAVAAPTARVRAFAAMLKNQGIDLFVLSNNRSPTRVANYCTQLGVPFLPRAGKPRPDSFYRAMEKMGRSPAETVVVGDQIFTDVLGAKRAGLTVLLVNPIELRGNLPRRLRHMAEQPMIALARARQRRGWSPRGERRNKR